MARERGLKPHSAAIGKGGFTLVELSIVLALIAILTVMMVSFSVLMNGYAADDKAEYDFLEDTAELKEALGTWVAENDTEDCTFVTSGNKITLFRGNAEVYALEFVNGILTVSEPNEASEASEALVSGLTGVNVATFAAEQMGGRLIRCETVCIDNDGQTMSASFVISLMCGGAVPGVGGDS